jgi:hypothetical protein
MPTGFRAFALQQEQKPKVGRFGSGLMLIFSADFFQRRRPVPSAFAARSGSVRHRARTIPATIDGFSR